MENFARKEQCIYNFSLSIDNIEKLRGIATYVPKELSVTDKLTNYLHGIHVDYDGDTPHIYDVPNCSLMELRGNCVLKKICNRHLHGILMDMKQFVEADEPTSLLHHLYDSYDIEMDLHPRSKYKYDFVAFIENQISLTDEMSIQKILEEGGDTPKKRSWEADLAFLEEFFEDNFHLFEYVTHGKIYITYMSFLLPIFLLISYIGCETRPSFDLYTSRRNFNHEV